VFCEENSGKSTTAVFLGSVCCVRERDDPLAEGIKDYGNGRTSEREYFQGAASCP